MSKDYKNIKAREPGSGSIISHVFSMLTGLCMGLLVAVYIYFFVPRADYGNIVNPALHAQETKAESKPESKQEKKKQALPEPKFDFYKILPNREINISEWIAEKDESVTDDANVYVFQVGSFKDYESADQVKARLALIGIQADIQRVVINGQDSRHRVRIGPFKDPEVLKDVSRRLNSNGLDYMLLKLRLKDGTEG